MLADPLPPETDLPADAVVFRGGTMQAADLARAFASHYDKRHDPKTGDCLPEQPPDRPHYCYALSVNAAPDLDLDAIALRAKRPNGQARVSSTTRILDAGFSLHETPGRREEDAHCDLYLPGSARMPTNDEISALELAFDAPIANPHPWRGQ